MTQEKANGPGYADLYWRMDDMVYRLVQEFKSGKPVYWPVITTSRLHTVWSNFSKKGYVEDGKVLDEIFASVRDNVIRLQICNIVSGHEGIAPASILCDNLAEAEHDAFALWLIESADGWRISDNGLGPLQDAIALAFEARIPSLRLKYLDRALHVTHMRGDLSRLFIEGGRCAIMEIDYQEKTPANVLAESCN